MKYLARPRNMDISRCACEEAKRSDESQWHALSHLVHSESQLDTREVGQQMMMRLAMGVPPSSSCPF